MRLRIVLTAAFGLFAIVLLGATLIPFGLLSASEHQSGYELQRVRETRSVVETLRGLLPDAQARIVRDRYPRGGFTAGWLLGPDTEPRAPATQPEAFPDDPATAPEILTARRGPDATRVGPSPLGERLFVAVPIIDGSRLDGILWISSSQRPVQDLDSRTFALLGLLGGVALIGAVALSTVLAGRLTRRLEVLAQAAGRFGEGRLGDPISIHGRDEIAKVARRLEEMASQITELRERDQRFVGSASHQLRSPLTAIRLRLDELTTMVPGSEEAKEYLMEIGEETDRLHHLVARLLVLTRVSRGQERGPVDVADAVELVARRLEPVARSRGVEIAIETTDATVNAPAGALDEVLLNLVDNAVKFSPPGQRVDIAWSVKDDAVHIVIRDRGPGIADPSAAFRPFFQPDPRTPGHGLGLTISQELAAQSDATISIREADGGGVQAEINWPRANGRSRP